MPGLNWQVYHEEMRWFGSRGVAFYGSCTMIESSTGSGVVYFHVLLLYMVAWLLAIAVATMGESRQILKIIFAHAFCSHLSRIGTAG